MEWRSSFQCVWLFYTPLNSNENQHLYYTFPLIRYPVQQINWDLNVKNIRLRENHTSVGGLSRYILKRYEMVIGTGLELYTTRTCGWTIYSSRCATLLYLKLRSSGFERLWITTINRCVCFCITILARTCLRGKRKNKNAVLGFPSYVVSHSISIT